MVSFDASGTEDEAGIKRASLMVNQLIAGEIKAGIPSQRIMIGGFSQGGAIAIHTALHTEHKVNFPNIYIYWTHILQTLINK